MPVDGVYPLGPSLDTVGPLGADVAAVELGMRLIEPGFAAGSCELAVGRIRPDIDIDPVTDAAVDAALAAAALRVADVAGFDFRAANGAGNVLIDVEAYQANAHLIPHFDRLSTQIHSVSTGIRDSQNSRCRLAHITPPVIRRAARSRWWWLFQ